MARKKYASWVIVIAGLAGAIAVQLAGAAPSPTQKIPVHGKVAMSSVDPFNGKIKVKDHDCVGPRPIRILNADTRALVASTNTIASSSKKNSRSWVKDRPFFSGSVIATAPRAGGCPPLRSSAVRHFGAAAKNADLAISKVSSSGNGLYAIVVTNLGPNQADGVVVTDTPQEPFTPPASDPRCAGAPATFSCNLGAIGPGGAIAFHVKTECGAVTVQNSASVSSIAPDPNLANNSVSNVPSTCS